MSAVEEKKAKKASKKAALKATEAPQKATEPMSADTAEKAEKKTKKVKKSAEEVEAAKEKASMEALEAAERLASKRKAGDDAGAPKKNKKRRKTKAARAAAEAEIPEEERKRREAQRELQRQIVQMRKEGKSAEDQNRTKRRFNKLNWFKKERTYEEKQDYRDIKQQKMEVAHEKGKEHELVIIPIAWKKHADEKGLIDAACTRVKERLMAKGVNAWIDKRTLYTPGQKFAYWEHLGVMLRVEIGPNDLQSKTCTVSQAKEAGQVADRFPQVSLSGADLLHRLKAMGLDGLEIDADDEEFEDGATAAEIELKPAQGGDDDAENFVLKADSENKEKKKRRRF